MSKSVIIAGAGYAGIQTALALERKKNTEDDLEIVIIERNEYHTLLTELHEVAGNRLDEEGAKVYLADIFKHTGVKVIRDEIEKIDLKNRAVYTGKGKHAYDYLVIATGSQPNLFSIPGMKEYAFTLWSLEDAIRIREHIKRCFVMAANEKNDSSRKLLLTFAVGGGGFTGVETIGEIAVWTKFLCSEFNIPEKDVTLMLVEALPRILTGMSGKNADSVLEYLENELKVKVAAGSPITNVGPNFFSLGDGTTVDSGTLIWTAGVKASGITAELDCNKGVSNRIVVDRYTGAEYGNAFAVGDVSAFPTREGILPGLVEAALQTGRTAAQNILSDLRGVRKKVLRPRIHGMVVSVGGSFAVSEVFGLRWPRFVSAAMKYLVNIHYLFGIGGIQITARYLKYEFAFKRRKKVSSLLLHHR